VSGNFARSRARFSLRPRRARAKEESCTGPPGRSWYRTRSQEGPGYCEVLRRRDRSRCPFDFAQASAPIGRRGGGSVWPLGHASRPIRRGFIAALSTRHRFERVDFATLACKMTDLVCLEPAGHTPAGNVPFTCNSDWTPPAGWFLPGLKVTQYTQ
jgi:hypothetical protein